LDKEAQAMTRKKTTRKRPTEEMVFNSQLDAVWHIVAEYIGIDPETADSKCRKRHLVRARHLYYYLAKNHTLHTWQSIAYYTGGRDHSTAIHGYNTIEQELEYDKKLRAIVVNIQDRLVGRIPEKNDILFDREKAMQFGFL
jgi:chromosomal replication initiation ATPase DnaA